MRGRTRIVLEPTAAVTRLIKTTMNREIGEFYTVSKPIYYQTDCIGGPQILLPSRRSSRGDRIINDEQYAAGPDN